MLQTSKQLVRSRLQFFSAAPQLSCFVSLGCTPTVTCNQNWYPHTHNFLGVKLSDWILANGRAMRLVRDFGRERRNEGTNLISVPSAKHDGPVLIAIIHFSWCLYSTRCSNNKWKSWIWKSVQTVEVVASQDPFFYSHKTAWVASAIAITVLFLSFLTIKSLREEQTGCFPFLTVTH